MNSLEFIENQIKEIDKQLDYYKRKIDEDCIFKSFIDNYTTTIKDLTNLKNTLLQIKTELEAWEVVKHKISIEKGSIDYANINIKDWNHHLSKDQYQKLKKALEVEE